MLECIYCAGRRQDPKLTLEHIWPVALGGAFCPRIFQTSQVCQRCNNFSGQWVDAAFLKSWFIGAEVAISAQQYMDTEQPSILPLLYMGFDEALPVSREEVCERWRGPSGEHIYHVHGRDDPRWDTVAGGDFIRRKRDDHGRVYIVLTSPNPYWSLTALVSLVSHFPLARRRCLTIVDGVPESIPIFKVDEPPINDTEAQEIDWILNLPGGERNGRLPLRIDFSDRFLAKLSLGLAHTILGPATSASSYAEKLRQLLWSRNPEEREELNIRGSGFWDQSVLNRAGKRGKTGGKSPNGNPRVQIKTNVFKRMPSASILEA